MPRKRSGKPGAYRQKSSRYGKLSLLLTAVLLLFGVLAAALLCNREPEGAPSVTEDAPIPETTQQIQQDPYENILKKYETAIETGWDPGVCVENDLSFLVGYHAGQPESLGYSQRDLDGNGTPELIISDGSVIYDLYTLSPEQKSVKLLSGSERMVYSLCQDGTIFYRGSGSAFLTGFVLYRVQDGKLEAEKAYLYDAGQDPEHPWFHSSDGTERGEPAITAEAEEWVNSRTPVEINIRIFG